jgi:hypothetical protein
MIMTLRKSRQERDKEMKEVLTDDQYKKITRN